MYIPCLSSLYSYSGYLLRTFTVLFTIICSIHHGITTAASTIEGAGYAGLVIGFSQCLLVYVSLVDLKAAVDKIFEVKQEQWHEANVNANLATAEDRMAFNNCMFIFYIYSIYIPCIFHIFCVCFPVLRKSCTPAAIEKALKKNGFKEKQNLYISVFCRLCPFPICIVKQFNLQRVPVSCIDTHGALRIPSDVPHMPSKCCNHYVQRHKTVSDKVP